MSTKHLVFEIEIPGMYTDDIDGLREFKGDDESESDFLLNCIGEPGVVRIRTEINGDKDSSVVEVWGSIRAVRLENPSRGYESSEPHLTDDQLAEHGFNLVRDEGRACEWCQGERVVSARRATPETCCVWLASKTATHLERIAYDVDDELDKALLLQIAEQIYAAPADPAEAAARAIECAWPDMSPDELHVTTSYVLVALGYPGGPPHQEETP